MHDVRTARRYAKGGGGRKDVRETMTEKNTLLALRETGRGLRPTSAFDRAKVRVARYCQGKLSVCLSVTLRYRDRLEFCENNVTAGHWSA